MAIGYVEKSTFKFFLNTITKYKTKVRILKKIPSKSRNRGKSTYLRSKKFMLDAIPK